MNLLEGEQIAIDNELRPMAVGDRVTIIRGRLKGHPFVIENISRGTARLTHEKTGATMPTRISLSRLAIAATRPEMLEAQPAAQNESAPGQLALFG